MSFIPRYRSSLEFESGPYVCLCIHRLISLSSSVKLRRLSISQPLRFVPLSDLFYLTYRVQFYSANPAMVFSGIIPCATDVRSSFPISLLFPSFHHTDDVPEVLSAGITPLGCQWCTSLTRDVMHLFALGLGSNKYETAVHFQANMHLKDCPSALVWPFH
jgi:hypothetical protein